MSFSTEKYLFVHAGIDPQKKLIDHKIQNREIKRTELSKLKGLSRVDQFKKIIASERRKAENIKRQ